MKELLKNIVILEKLVEELKEKSDKKLKKFYIGYLKGIRETKWLLLKQIEVI